MQIQIHPLNVQDAKAYRQLRLTALESDPNCFLSTYDTENQKADHVFETEIIASSSPPVFGYWGVFDKDKLIAYCHIAKSFLAKQAHIAFLYNLYVDPDHRHQGLAAKLLRHTIDELKRNVAVERIFLSCNAKNKNAISFYKKCGFKQYGTKQKSIKWQDKYDDEVEMVYEV